MPRPDTTYPQYQDMLVYGKNDKYKYTRACYLAEFGKRQYIPCRTQVVFRSGYIGSYAVQYLAYVANQFYP